MIDPKTVLVGIPCHNGTNMTELTGMLVTCRDLYGGITMPTECSHPSLARNVIADIFLRSPFQWLFGIDWDIVFRRSDFLLLLEEVDSTALYTNPDVTAHPESTQLWGKEVTPEPTRIEAGCLLRGDEGHLEPEVRPADALVCAEYAYKKEPFEPVRFGGGFYRVHRHVFETLQELKHEDNGRREVDVNVLNKLKALAIGLREKDPATAIREIPDSLLQRLFDSETSIEGTPRLWQTRYQGRTFYDYYPSGPLVSQQVPTGEWKGEDHGFWTLCHLGGLIPRIERRTRLIHIGRKGYPYEPDQEIAQ